MPRTTQRTIYVYANWLEHGQPVLLGILTATPVKGREVFSFEYDPTWLKSGRAQNLDPDLGWYGGAQYLPDSKSNFGIFLDSSPDRWGRVLMDRREAILAREGKRRADTLFETDYLLGVYDGHRMGALRFKDDLEGPFLNDNTLMASPPWTSIRALEEASRHLEEGSADDSETLRWINLLLAPGSSLGGARPKASVIDQTGQLWIAKFPSRNDSRDIGAWEMVVHELALQAGLHVAESRCDTYYSRQHTFLTRRFDRTPQGARHHFASAMTLLGQVDGISHREGMSYLDLVEFISKNGVQIDQDLQELWRRIVFYICVSNTDDHLRNHGFLFTEGGWRLSPAFDINPAQTGAGLSLNISEKDNSLDLGLALEVAEYFRVDSKRAEAIIKTVRASVSSWSTVAQRYGISKAERDTMERAFQAAF